MARFVGRALLCAANLRSGDRQIRHWQRARDAVADRQAGPDHRPVRKGSPAHGHNGEKIALPGPADFPVLTVRADLGTCCTASRCFGTSGVRDVRLANALPNLGTATIGIA